MPSNGLLVNAPFARQLVRGEKTLELRKKNIVTHLGRPVAIIETGHPNPAPNCLGHVTFTSPTEYTFDELVGRKEAHRCDFHQLAEYMGERLFLWCWKATCPTAYKFPRLFPVSQGAQEWVILKKVESFSKSFRARPTSTQQKYAFPLPRFHRTRAGPGTGSPTNQV